MAARARLLGKFDRGAADRRRAALHPLQVPELPGRGRQQPAGARRQAAAHMPLRGLRQGLRQDVAPQGPSPAAHGRAAVSVPALLQALHPQRRAAASLAHAHRREEIRLHALPQEVHAQRPPQQAQEDPREPEEATGQEGGRGRCRREQGERRAAPQGHARAPGSPRHAPAADVGAATFTAAAVGAAAFTAADVAAAGFTAADVGATTATDAAAAASATTAHAANADANAHAANALPHGYL